MLRPNCGTEVIAAWRGEPCDALIALHARRSADSIRAFAQAHPDRPCIVVLTGTDLYRDIRSDAAAQASLSLATHLVVLQDQGLAELSPALQAKARVIYQSAPPLQPARVPKQHLRVLFVGHLRDEKDPLTFLHAAERLQSRRDIHFELIGHALDADLGREVERVQSICPRLRWLGALPHAATRQRIKRAQLLVNTSRMEGGAQVILEAVQSGTAVLATRIPGNVGMLGPQHAGLFDPGDDAALTRLIERARDDARFLDTLRAQTRQRSPLFDPVIEQQHLRQLITTALENPR